MSDESSPSKDKGDKALMKSALVWNFVKYLNEEFMGRCRRNSAYSLRAFARDLDMDSGTLSQFMSGKRKFTDKNIIKLALSFGFDESEADHFVRDTLDFYAGDVFSFAEQNDDTWHFHADWRHSAILVLMQCRDFVPELAHIAGRLKQEIEDLRPVLERMVRIGVLVIHPDGHWENKAENYISTRGYPREKNPAPVLNSRLFGEGQRALSTVPYVEREFLTLVFECDPSKIDQARAMFKKFRTELYESMRTDRPAQAEVYCLAMGLFPLGQSKK